MKSIAVILLGLALTQAPPVGKVDSTLDKSVDFAAFRTYQWLPGTPAFNPEVHKMIVAALEAEMSAVGLTKAASGADVSLAYYTTSVTNVDLKALDKIEREGGSRAAANKTLGKLVVVLRTPNREQVWTAATREYLEQNLETFGATIKTVTARLFETYPKRAR